MSIRIVCPNCRTAYNATDDQGGRRVRCKECQTIFWAAGPEAEANALARENQAGGQELPACSDAATADGRHSEKASRDPGRPRRKKARRKIPPFALFLIISSVSGSLLIVAASAIFCVWLWIDPPARWRTSKPVDAGPRFPLRPNFPMQAPNIQVNQAADGDVREIARQEAEVQEPLPPPPRELDFACPAVEPKLVSLVLRHQVGSRPLILNSWFSFKVAGLDGVEHTGWANAQTRLTETTEAVDAQELASVRLQYRAYQAMLHGHNQEPPDPAVLPQARQHIKRLAANLRIDRQGNLVGNEVDLSGVPAAVRPCLANLHEEVGRALECLMVPLPNRQVAPGESWKAERSLFLPALSRSMVADLNMSYSYAGTRERAGREEAVLELKGVIRRLGIQSGRATGRATGVAAVDLASGQVTEAQMLLVFDVAMYPRAHSLPSGGKLMLRLRRDLPPGSAGN